MLILKCTSNMVPAEDGYHRDQSVASILLIFHNTQQKLSGDMTGKESYYTVYAGHEVMYHVSTMLPYSKDNPQQLERKRHIGNDIVNIVYTDDSDAIDMFNPNCIRSQFTRKSSILAEPKVDEG